MAKFVSRRRKVMFECVTRKKWRKVTWNWSSVVNYDDSDCFSSNVRKFSFFPRTVWVMRIFHRSDRTVRFFIIHFLCVCKQNGKLSSEILCRNLLLLTGIVLVCYSILIPIKVVDLTEFTNLISTSQSIHPSVFSFVRSKLKWIACLSNKSNYWQSLVGSNWYRLLSILKIHCFLAIFVLQSFITFSG